MLSFLAGLARALGRRSFNWLQCCSRSSVQVPVVDFRPWSTLLTISHGASHSGVKAVFVPTRSTCAFWGALTSLLRLGPYVCGTCDVSSNTVSGLHRHTNVSYLVVVLKKPGPKNNHKAGSPCGKGSPSGGLFSRRSIPLQQPPPPPLSQQKE